jgi:hypothetical protein
LEQVRVQALGRVRERGPEQALVQVWVQVQEPAQAREMVPELVMELVTAQEQARALDCLRARVGCPQANRQTHHRRRPSLR